METKARTARQRAREEITAEILNAARARLAASGPGDLSLRAVARDVGMVSSAVYRYFASRDELLTALLIRAYDELGATVETADESIVDRTDTAARWLASCRATRAWAVEHPHDYALLYGSPVSGYAAPQDTITPATRVIVRLAQIVTAANEQGALPRPAPDGVSTRFGSSFGSATQEIARFGGRAEHLPTEMVGRTLMAWSTVFGTISFELWGHLVGAVDDHEAFFDGVVVRLWDDIAATQPRHA